MGKFKTRRLTESAIMIALASVLALVKVWEMPLGGSVTAASMVPIIFVALRYGPKWGCLTSVTYAAIQMMQSFYAPPTKSLWAFVAVVMLDYIIAFGALGLAKIFANFFKKNKITGAIVATAAVCTIRFLSHLMSGIIIWHTGNPAVSDFMWSLTYNGTFMLPEAIISVVSIALLMKFVKLPAAE